MTSRRVGVFSDLHADGQALDVLWAAMEREAIAGVWCLGDFCSGGPDTVRCFDEILSRCEVVLAGNHERFLIEHRFESSRGEWADQARQAHTALGRERRRVLARLPSGGMARGVFAVHGRPGAPRCGFLRTAADAAAAIAHVDSRVVVYGHTHEVAWWEPTDGGARRRQVSIGTAAPVPAGSLLNPGAACDPTGVRWLALDIAEDQDDATSHFVVTFHREPRRAARPRETWAAPDRSGAA